MRRTPSILVIILASIAAGAAVVPSAAAASGRGWTAHKATGLPLLSVAAAGPAHAWAVGPDSTIVATTDGGASWLAQNVAHGHRPVRRRLLRRGRRLGGGRRRRRRSHRRHHRRRRRLGGADRPDDRGADRRGLARGGRLGGRAPTARSSPPPTAARPGPRRARRPATTCTACRLPTPTTAGPWATLGVILATTDGGAVWTCRDRRPADYLNGVTCTDALHAWAVGEKGVDPRHHRRRRPLARAPPRRRRPPTCTRSPSPTRAAAGRSASAASSWRPPTAARPGGRKPAPRARISPRSPSPTALHGFVAGVAGAMLTTSHAGWSDASAAGGHGAYASWCKTGLGPVELVATGATAAGRTRRRASSFSASDGAGGSGVASVQYSLDGGATWTRGYVVPVAAPADHATTAPTRSSTGRPTTPATSRRRAPAGCVSTPAVRARRQVVRRPPSAAPAPPCAST